MKGMGLMAAIAGVMGIPARPVQRESFVHPNDAEGQERAQQVRVSRYPQRIYPDGSVHYKKPLKGVACPRPCRLQ